MIFLLQSAIQLNENLQNKDSLEMLAELMMLEMITSFNLWLIKKRDISKR